MDFSQRTGESQELRGSASPKLVAYDYDQAGNRIGLSYPADVGIQLSMTADPIGRVEQILRNGQDWTTYQYTGSFLDLRRIKTQSDPETFLEYDVSYDDHRRQDQIINRSTVGGSPMVLAQFDGTQDTVGRARPDVFGERAWHRAQCVERFHRIA